MSRRTTRFSALTACLLAFGPMLMIGPGCSAPADEEPDSTGVSVGAAFTTLKSADIYSPDGKLLIRLSGDRPIHEDGLPHGTYYLDLRDHYGNGIFDADEQLLFVPKVSGAELDLTPRRLNGTERLMVRITVGPHKTVTPNQEESLGEAEQAVHTFGGNEAAMRSRVVWEAARAMVGPSAASYHHWPETPTNSRYRYVSEDRGAWNSLRRQYGYYLSCRDDSDQWDKYYPCRITFGPDDPYQYEVQNGWYKGGQCKAFSNLVIYRSGVHHGSNWSLRALPPDRSIDGSPPNFVRAKPGSLQAGDVLRMPYGHSAIVVRVLNYRRAVVIDSNWIGGEGWENIGTHVMEFSGDGVSNLGNYYRLNCVYSGSC